MAFRKVKNLEPPCNCGPFSKCIRCPCSRKENGLLVNYCTDLCLCSNYCSGKKPSSRDPIIEKENIPPERHLHQETQALDPMSRPMSSLSMREFDEYLASFHQRIGFRPLNNDPYNTPETNRSVRNEVYRRVVLAPVKNLNPTTAENDDLERILNMRLDTPLNMNYDIAPTPSTAECIDSIQKYLNEK